ncbi:MAG: aminotransferase class III-fold pyridoxal phosphate-dependent enzyme [Bifidobacteriaceae bacterium]|jgi:taurine--2-oxoglutarate transaminase|nr:aminotransferase class III-fold pyridoxal phosphate-dependent enzyme [Bifidobacteriaceae bacterium]
MSEFDGLEGAALDAAIIAADHARVLHSWSAQANLPQFTVAGGQGARLWDHAGREWIDFTSQLVNANIGLQHPAVVEAIVAQARTLATIAPATANRARAEAAAAILAHTPRPLAKVFFTNAGADAVENAIRLARAHTGRPKVISFYRSYHGNTGAAIMATGEARRLGNEFAWGHRHVFGPYLYRSENWSATREEESARALQALDHTIEAEGPETVAAILIETIPGSAGVLVPPPGYLAGVRRIADKHGIVFILDEVMCGFGRTGTWFARDLWDVTPDLLVFAKGVNSGYVPAGGVAIASHIAAGFDHRPFPGGLTYSGHPLAMAAIAAAIRAMEDEDVVGNAERIGAQVLGPGLTAIAESNPLVGEVRGAGVFWALELVRDQATREPLAPDVIVRVKALATERGLLPLVMGNRFHVAPPCVITPSEARRGLEILRSALDDAATDFA